MKNFNGSLSLSIGVTQVVVLSRMARCGRARAAPNFGVQRLLELQLCYCSGITIRRWIQFMNPYSVRRIWCCGHPNFYHIFCQSCPYIICIFVKLSIDSLVRWSCIVRTVVWKYWNNMKYGRRRNKVTTACLCGIIVHCAVRQSPRAYTYIILWLWSS